MDKAEEYSGWTPPNGHWPPPPRGADATPEASASDHAIRQA